MYQFKLTPMQSSQRIQLTSIDYTPLTSKSFQSELSVIPVYNNDKEVATPAFILECEQNQVRSNLKYHQKVFAEKLHSASVKRKQLMIPKPNHKIQICSVCKQEYNDYLTHIYGKIHRKNIHSSEYFRKIRELSTTIPQDMENKNSNEITDCQIIYSPFQAEDTQIFQRIIQKKVKTDNFPVIKVPSI